jgi:hypothetical protein
MANVHTVCETTNLRCVHYAERIWDAVANFDVDNGTFGYLDGLKVEGGVIYNFVTGTKEGSAVVMAHNPEWTEDTCRRTNQRKDKFYIKANVPFRAYTLHEGDEFAVSTEAFSGTPEVGKYVTINANGKLEVSDSAPADGAAMVGKIMRSRIMGTVITTVEHDYGYSRKMYEVKVESLA